MIYIVFAILACAAVQLAASLTIGRNNDEATRITTGVLIVITTAALLSLLNITDIVTVLIIFTLFTVSAVVRLGRERFDTVSHARKELEAIKRELEHAPNPQQ